MTATTEPTLGNLVATATRDLSTLFRQEVALARVEITRDVLAAGKGAGMFGGAGMAGVLALGFLSIAAAFGIAALGTPLGVGFLAVGLLYLAGAATLALNGRRQLRNVGPPTRTIETVKDDVAWAKHPTRTV